MTEEALRWKELLIEIETGEHPKTIGILGISLYQGKHRLIRREYGRDEFWSAGSTVCFIEPIDVPAPGEPVMLVASFEQAEDASPATWDAGIRALLTKSDGERVEIRGAERFVTRPECPMHIVEFSASGSAQLR